MPHQQSGDSNPEKDAERAAAAADLEARQNQDTASAAADDSTQPTGTLPEATAKWPDTIVTAMLTQSSMQLQLSAKSGFSTDVVATYDFHAFFVKDQTTCSYLDQYNEATAELWKSDISLHGASMQPTEGSELFASLVKRLQKKSEDTRVLLTVKKKVPALLSGQYERYVHRLCEQLELSKEDTKIVSDAGQIHALARFQHLGANPHGSRRGAESPVELLAAMHDEPAIVAILRGMYRDLARCKESAGTLEVVGANVLTIVDLLSDRLHSEQLSDRAVVATLKHEFGRLIDKLFLRRVAEAFAQILEDDLPEETAKERNGVLIYTDLIHHIFPLESRLRNEGLKVMTTDVLEECMHIARRKSPSLVVLRMHGHSQHVVKAVHYLLSNGVDLSEIPTFVLVNERHVEGLTGLLAMGIEDILDIEGSLDSLIIKIKKARARVEVERQTRLTRTQKSGTSGNLSDMNLIDLLQAMGPSQRTACLTITSDGDPQGTLTVYLDKGHIIFAELDDLVGEAAIQHSLSWIQGTWVIELVHEDELPEPNNHQSNEAILMEGCRLLDENRKQAGV